MKRPVKRARVSRAEVLRAGQLLWAARVAMWTYMENLNPPIKCLPSKPPSTDELMCMGMDALRRAARLPTLSDLEKKAREQANQFVSELAAKREIPPVGEKAAP